MRSRENKKYWNECNADYSKVWQTRGRQEMSKLELELIDKYLKKLIPRRILDVGVGNGRILDNLIKFSAKQAKIFGIDVSEQMVSICKKKFRNESKVKQISVCDLSQEDICFDTTFDFVTMIRVLKYNKEWKKMIKRIYQKLNPGGVCIFTMPNKISISAFSGDTFSDQGIPIIYSSHREIREVLLTTGFKRILFRDFSKMPNFLYHIWQNWLYVHILISVEKALRVILGRSFLGRELFVICQK